MTRKPQPIQLSLGSEIRLGKFAQTTTLLVHTLREPGMVTQLASGHCLCGAIHFEADAEPLSTGLCHCESCRRHTGSVVAAFVTYPKNAVRWSGAEPTRYRSSPSVTRSFCSGCGSPLAYEHDQSAAEIELYLGALDDPARFPPQHHSHFRERVAWFDTVDRSPRHGAGSGSDEMPPASVEPTPSETPPIPAGQIPPIPRS